MVNSARLSALRDRLGSSWRQVLLPGKLGNLFEKSGQGMIRDQKGSVVFAQLIVVVESCAFGGGEFR